MSGIETLPGLGLDPEPQVLAVADLAHRIRVLLEADVGEVCVEGEVSNFTEPRSGHWYFTIKDASAQFPVVMFRRSQGGASTRPRVGMQIRVFGGVTLYEPQGRAQLIAPRLEEAGLGALHAAFEKLKQRLQAEGLFDETRKRPLPLLPRRVGIVTSPTGAAIRDMLNVLARRFPNLHLILAPTRVQGEGAAEEIAAAIDRLNAHGGIDVMIVGRGGGSLEDLWAFNEEPVARAIVRSAIPVISAVGHETDFTISDFVADLRAPTPSAAAELVVGRKDQFVARIDELSRRMRQALVRRRLEWRRRFERVALHHVFQEPRHLAQRTRQQLDFHRRRLDESARGRLRTHRQQLDEAQLRIQHTATARLDAARRDLRRLEAQLRALGPEAVMRRGFSVTLDDAGRVLRDAGALQPGARVHTRLWRGGFTADVQSVTPASTPEENTP